MPYTYRLSWSKLNMHYYGVRYAAKSSPEDLLKSYFTSSKHVHKFINENGNPDIIKVKNFVDVDSARRWETKFLTRVNAGENLSFLNKTNNISISPAAANHGWSLESRLKASKSHSGKPSPTAGKKRSEETKLKMSLVRLGKKRSEETKKLMSDKQKAAGGYGPKKHSEETKLKMSISHRSKYK